MWAPGRAPPGGERKSAGLARGPLAVRLGVARDGGDPSSCSSLLSIGASIALRDLATVLDLGELFTAATGERSGILVGNPFSLANFLLIGLVGLALTWAAAAIRYAPSGSG